MGYEVEIKFRVADPSALVARITEAGGFAADGDVPHVDEYLAHPGRDFRQTDEALRIRTEGDGNALTYKGPKQGGPTKTREEIEVGFSPGDRARDELRTLLERLGFRPVATVRKTRTTYQVLAEGRALAVTLDHADGLGTFAEVETLAASADDLSAAQQAVLDLAHRLGLEDVEPRSYLRMLLEQTGQSG